MCRPRYSHQLARSSAVRPAPAASAQQKTPISLPATAASPAVRPSRTVRCRNSAVDGPGSAATARQASRNAEARTERAGRSRSSADYTRCSAPAAKRFPVPSAQARRPARLGGQAGGPAGTVPVRSHLAETLGRAGYYEVARAAAERHPADTSPSTPGLDNVTSVIEHWNGTSWTAVPAVNANGAGEGGGAAAFPRKRLV